MERPFIEVAVVFEREAKPNRWEEWRHQVAEVVADEQSFGDAPRLLHDDGHLARSLFPGFRLELYVDECEGYYLNLTSGAPVWFVMWRIDDEDASRAWPEEVSLSYNEAGRWLDSQERVDNVPLPADVRDWLHTFTATHYRPEPKGRKRPPSFLPPSQRG